MISAFVNTCRRPRAYPLSGVRPAEPSGRGLRRSRTALRAQPQPPRLPHEHTRRRNCHHARRPASKCPSYTVGVTVPNPEQNTACHRIGRRPPVYRMVVILMQGRSRRLWQAANPKVGTRGQVSGISSACWRGRMTANHTAPEALPTLTRVYHDGLLEQLQPSPQSTTHAPALRPVSVREGTLMPQPGSHAG